MNTFIETHYSIPGAPSLAVISDMHGYTDAQWIYSLEANKPSIICFTGDLFDISTIEDDTSPLAVQDNVLLFVQQCANLALCFISLGNHEAILDSNDLNKLNNAGAVVLDNTWREKDDVLIGGLSSAFFSDYKQYRENLPEEIKRSHRYPPKENTHGIRGLKPADNYVPEVEWLDMFVKQAGYHILLSHHPEYYPFIPQSIELIISGHCHGGQVRLFNPVNRQWFGIYGPGEGFLPRWTKGIYDGRLLVSAGLSNTILIPRLFNPKEIVYVNTQ